MGAVIQDLDGINHNLRHLIPVPVQSQHPAGCAAFTIAISPWPSGNGHVLLPVRA